MARSRPHAGAFTCVSCDEDEHDEQGIFTRPLAAEPSPAIGPAAVVAVDPPRARVFRVRKSFLAMAGEDSEPADDPNDRDFAPSSLLLRRPRARLPGGVPEEGDTPAAASVSDMASAKKELLSKMSAQGHQAFIRYNLR